MVQESSVKQKLLIIAGPTAVGKTKFSIECAKKFNGEIVSADSIQIYKHLDIGSAKATAEERSQAVHHLIDVVEPNESFSASEFKNYATKAIDEIIKKGKLPILVGGTGLFIKSILFPYSFGGTDKNENIRKKYQDYLEKNGIYALHKLLYNVDKKSAESIEPENTRRVIRALEIYELTGKEKSLQNEESESVYDYKLLFLNRNREELYENINNRVDTMLKSGLLNEVENLIKTYNLDRNSQSMQGIGYKEFFDYFEDKCTLFDVAENIKKATRHYAKRQITYFKKMPKVEFVDYNSDKISLVEDWLNN